MAIRLNLSDTHIVLSALQEYRATLRAMPADYDRDPVLDDVERLIKSYKRSFAALGRIGR